eukprot:16436611-Heterocapsa_arctica.AAC.2
MIKLNGTLMEVGSPATGAPRMNGVTVAQMMHKPDGVPTLSIPEKARYLNCNFRHDDIQTPEEVCVPDGKRVPWADNEDGTQGPGTNPWDSYTTEKRILGSGGYATGPFYPTQGEPKSPYKNLTREEQTLMSKIDQEHALAVNNQASNLNQHKNAQREPRTLAQHLQ